MKRAASTCAALLALGGLTVACGDNNTTTDGGIDSGPRDSGIDAPVSMDDAGQDGGQDGGPPDAGPPPSHLRLAHLIPGGPDVHICLYIPAASTTGLLITRDPDTSAPRAIPYKGVSGYTDIALPPIDVRVKVFDAADVSGDTCPASGEIINQVIPGAGVLPDTYYTVAATGIIDGTGDSAPELRLFEDDLSAPTTAGDTRLRFYNAVPNFPVTVVGIDLCFDPDGPTGPTEPEELLENASFEEVNDYLEHTPITVGLLTLHAYNPAAPNCFMMAPPVGTLLAQIPVPIPLPAGVPANYTATFDGDTSNTIFMVGDATITTNGATCATDADCTTGNPAGTVCSIPAGAPGGRCSHPNGVTILPIEDSLGL